MDVLVPSIMLQDGLAAPGSNNNGTAPNGGNQSGKSKTNLAPIVGGAVGGVVLLAMLGFLVFFWIRRKKNIRKANENWQIDPSIHGHSFTSTNGVRPMSEGTIQSSSSFPITGKRSMATSNGQPYSVTQFQPYNPAMNGQGSTSTTSALGDPVATSRGSVPPPPRAPSSGLMGGVSEKSASYQPWPAGTPERIAMPLPPVPTPQAPIQSPPVTGSTAPYSGTAPPASGALPTEELARLLLQRIQGDNAPPQYDAR